jgi:hypothetical protein
MKRIKKFVALALVASMVFATTSTAFAKNAQTSNVPSNSASTETLTIPMIKNGNGKWVIDPLFAYIGIKNIKWNSEIQDRDLSIKKGAAKISIDNHWKYAPYALLIKQKGTIVPHKTAPTQTRDIEVHFYVRGERQDELYTKHIVTLAFVQRESPLVSLKIGPNDYKVEDFATTNSAKLYKKANWGYKGIQCELQPYYKNLKLVAIGKNGHNWVIRATSGNKITVASVNFKLIKAIQIRYTLNHKELNKIGVYDYSNYLKNGVVLPNTTGCLTINIK